MSLFIITDGNKNYIRRDINGRYVKVKSRALADEFSDRWKAKKVLDNNLNPKARKGYYISEEETGIMNPEIPVIQNPQPIKIEVKVNTDECVDKIGELKDKILNLQKFVTENENRRTKLCDSLSSTDKEITDIQHYIEFSDLDADESLKVYQMLKERLKSRRNIKNELSILRQLVDCKMETSMLDDILIAISELDNKKYVPRVLTELFS